MSETIVAQASADTDRDWPRDRHRSARDRDDLDQLGAWRRATTPTGTITFTVFGPQSRPRPAATGWHDGRNRDGLRQRHLPPVGRLHADFRW